MMCYNDNPMVSIIIPVYNGANYLHEAITSAIEQDYDNFEVLVVNDGSNDDGATERVAQSFGDKIRYIHKENGGVSSALNCGIENMKGEYFSWLSHDDKYTPNKLKNLINLIKYSGDDKIVALSGVTHIDKASKRVKDVTYHFERQRIYSGDEIIQYMLKYGGLNGCALLIPKSAFEKCGGFNEELRYNQDLLMWYKIFGNGYKLIADVDNKDVMYRLHPMQTSKTRRDLLLKDSLTMTKIVIPILSDKKEYAKNNMKLFAKRYAMHDCKDAVMEVINSGNELGIFSSLDRIELIISLLKGKLRNILKLLFIAVRLK